jgi:solute carrier family 35 protein F3/4
MTANLAYVGALASAPAAVCTAVFATTPAWVFVLSRAALPRARAELTRARALAVLLAVAGVALEAAGAPGGFSGGGGGARVSGAARGVALVLLASVAAAAYKVAFARAFGDVSGADVAWFLTALAALCALLGALVSLTPQRRALWGALPLRAREWALLGAHTGASVLFNFAVNWGVVLTSPLDVAIGTILGIPLALVVEAVRAAVTASAFEVNGLSLAGCAIIIVSLALQLHTPKSPRRARAPGSGAAA